MGFLSVKSFNFMGTLPWKAVNIFDPTYGRGIMHICLPDLSCQHFNLYSIYVYQKRSFARKYSTKSWVFATNILNDLLPSVHLDLYEPYAWLIIFSASSCIIKRYYYANFSTAFDHWLNLIFISKFVTCMDTLFGGPYNFLATINGSEIMHCLLPRCHW